MIEYIDGQRRLTPEEHCCLHRFYLRSGKGTLPYPDFDITETLIGEYNRCPLSEKVAVAEETRRDPDVPAFLQAFQDRPWEYEKPVIWNDRKKTPYFIRQLRESHAFEVYIDWLFRTKGVDIGLYYGREQQYHQGETRAGIEIKCDKRSAETGNYYIEYRERMHDGDPWVDSGILKKDETRYYLLGTAERFAVFERGWLLDIYRRLTERGERVEGAILTDEKAHGTSRGFLLRPSAAQRGEVPLDELISRL